MSHLKKNFVFTFLKADIVSQLCRQAVQKVSTLIRLLLHEQSGLGLHFLSSLFEYFGIIPYNKVNIIKVIHINDIIIIVIVIPLQTVKIQIR